MQENQNKEEKIYYVYRHRRLDDFSIFYIGMGKGRRAFDKYRSQHWKNIVNKHGYEVEIVANDLSKDEAYELEVLLIKLYGRLNTKEGFLINRTDGGEGSVNHVWTDEMRKQRSELNKGKLVGDKNPMYGKYGELNPNFGKRWSDEKRKAFSDKKKDYYKSNEPPFKGKKHTEESKLKISLNKKACKCGKHDKAVKVYDFRTGVVYDCITEAAKSFELSITTLGRYLRQNRKDKTHLMYLTEYLDQKLM